MSKLLISESPIMILPSLAVRIGVNEAVVMQQVHYWLVKSSHVKEGRTWIYNTYKDWQEQLPFWSESTIKRAVKSLEEKGLLMTANWNKAKLDNTKWYSIDYQKLATFENANSLTADQTSVQPDLANRTNWNATESNLTTPIPENTSENSTEKKNPVPFEEIIDYLNAKTQSNYKAKSKKTQELIVARWNEGFMLEDFKKVIDLKTEEWLDDPYWNKFLRPQTLFGPKFEAYVNQKSPIQMYRDEEFDLND
ncbi:conserved phage C-terminal domain-containing protein [Pseudoneobacillus sp. C159]